MTPDHPTTDSFVGGRSQGLTPASFRTPEKVVPQRAGHAEGLAMGHARYGVRNDGDGGEPAAVRGSMANVAPPGMEKTVKALKKEPEVDNPFALAWWLKGEGQKSWNYWR